MSFGIFDEQNPKARAVDQMNKDLEKTINWLEVNVTTPSGNPVGYMTKGTGPKEGSIFAPRTEVTGDANPIGLGGQINLPKNLAGFVRKIMQNEVRRRKPSLYRQKDLIVPEINRKADEILRGTWWRGQKTLPELKTKDGKIIAEHRYSNKAPKTDEFGRWIEDPDVTHIWEGPPDLRHSRSNIGNLGEPTGISMSSRPSVAEKFSAGKSNTVARVMPQYGADPMDVVLRQWEPQHREIIAESYIDAAKKIFKEKGDEYIPFAGETKDYLESFQGEFNTQLTKNLQSKGYKGILYHPDRYGEAELKMFKNSDVLVVDKRGFGSDVMGPSPRNLAAKPGKAITDRYNVRKMDQVADFESVVYETGTPKFRYDGLTDTVKADKPIQGTSLRDIYKEMQVTKKLEDQLPYGKMAVDNVRNLLVAIRGYNHAKIFPESTLVKTVAAQKTQIEGWKTYLKNQYGNRPMPEGVKKIYNLIEESDRHIEELKKLSFTKEKGTNSKIIRHKEALRKLFDEAGELNDEIGKKVRF